MAENSIFETRDIQLAGTKESVVIGGRDKFRLLPEAFKGIEKIGVIGWGSQGPAQAQNLRESLEGTGIRVSVGLREGSASFAKAADDGFSIDNGTAGEMYNVIRESDLVLLLTADAAQAEQYQDIQLAMRSGKTLGLSHGFLIGHMKNVGAKFREDINVVGVCPKGMGPSVRRLYVQGREVNGAGINASYAVHQDATGNARNIALGWAIGIGSPYVFETTLEMEYRSDIFGERAILLGAVWGMLEALYIHFLWQEHAYQAFQHSVMSLTGPISEAIQEGGLLNLVSTDSIKESEFYNALHHSYEGAKPLVTEIYSEVASGREIASVIDATNRLQEYPWTKVNGSPMWVIGEKVRADARAENTKGKIHPLTAGIYAGIMLAQVDVLRENGHGWSEICNESIIEAVDSLNPYMAARGVDYMVDNCSTTARLGTRKWGPRFMQMVLGDVLPNIGNPIHPRVDKLFRGLQIHSALAECMKFRPPVSISVT